MRKPTFYVPFRNTNFNYLKYYNWGKKKEMLDEFPAIKFLDSFFTDVAYTNSTPIGKEGEGWTGSHEVVAKAYVNTKNSQIASIGGLSTSMYHTKQLNLWPIS